MQIRESRAQGATCHRSARDRVETLELTELLGAGRDPRQGVFGDPNAKFFD